MKLYFQIYILILIQNFSFQFDFECKTFIKIDLEDFKIENFLYESVNLSFILLTSDFQTSKRYHYNESYNFFQNPEIPLKLQIYPLIFGRLKYSSSCTFLSMYEDLTLLNALIYTQLIRVEKDILILTKNSNFPENDRNNLVYASVGNFKTIVPKSPENFQDLRNILDKFRNPFDVLKGHKVRLVSSRTTFVFREIPGENGGKSTCEGTYQEIMVDLEGRFNFSYKSGFAPNRGEAGMKLKNNTWTGGAGQIFRREVEILTGVSFSPYRTSITDTTVHLFNAEHDFLIFFPGGPPKWTIISRPFSPLVWLIIICVIGILIIVLFFIRKFDINEVKSNFGNMISRLILQPIVEQSNDEIERYKNGRVRIIFFIWILANLILSTGFKAKLFGFLTFMEPGDVPRSFKQLGYRSDYNFYFRSYGGWDINIFSESRLPYLRNIIQRAVITSSDKCVQEAILNENTACIDFPISMRFALASNFTIKSSDELIWAKTFIFSDQTASRMMLTFLFPKWSKLRSIFHTLMSWTIDSGLHNKILEFDYRKTMLKGGSWFKNQIISKNQNSTKVFKLLGKTKNDLKNVSKPLKFLSLLAPFLILFFGIVISLFAHLVEQAWKFKNVKKIQFEQIYKDQIIKIGNPWIILKKWVFDKEIHR